MTKDELMSRGYFDEDEYPNDDEQQMIEEQVDLIQEIFEEASEDKAHAYTQELLGFADNKDPFKGVK